MATKRVPVGTETVVAPATRTSSRWSRLPGVARAAVLVGAGLAVGLFVGHRGGLLPRGGDDGGFGRARMGGQMGELRVDVGQGGFGLMGGLSGGLSGGPRGGHQPGFDGTVSAVSGNSVTITAANGTSVTVTLPAAATVFTQHAGSVQDLTTGAAVHVDLVPGTTDQATNVIVTK